MVTPKNVTFREEKAQSPKRFQEPEGMTDIDLRRLSELSGFSETSLRKFDPKIAKKALCRTLFIAICLGCIFLVLFLLASNRGTSMKKLFHIHHQPQTDINDLVSYYIDKLHRCKNDKTLEACCTFIAEEPLAAAKFSLQDCTVDKIIEAIEHHELDSLIATDASSAKYAVEPTDLLNYNEFDLSDEYIDPDFIKKFIQEDLKNMENVKPSIRTVVEVKQLVQPLADQQSHEIPLLDKKMKRQAPSQNLRRPSFLNKDFEVYNKLPQQLPMRGSPALHAQPMESNMRTMQETHRIQEGQPPMNHNYQGYTPERPVPHNFQGFPEEDPRLEQQFPPQRFQQLGAHPQIAMHESHGVQSVQKQLNLGPISRDPILGEEQHNSNSERFAITVQRPSHATHQNVGGPTARDQPPHPPLHPEIVGSHHNEHNAELEEFALRDVVRYHSENPRPHFRDDVEIDQPPPMLQESQPRIPPTSRPVEVVPRKEKNLNARVNSRGNVQFSSGNDNNQQNPINSKFNQNQCISTYTPPVGSPLSIIQQQVPLAYDTSSNFAQLVPISLQRPQTPYVVSPQYTYYQQIIPNNVNTRPQMQNSGGPYILCNTMVGNNIAGMSGVEVRQNDPHLMATNMREKNRALTRSSEMCGMDQEICADHSKCVSSEQICDDVVDCDDGSDEAFCSCRYRVGPNRRCDGYLDCPNGEDELGCNGCDVDSFNCDDWSYARRATCIPMKQRCDGIAQCPTGNDEQDCSALLDFVETSIEMFKISNNFGFLHRNYKGRWYPVCQNGEAWASEACSSQMGSSRLPPLVQMLPINYPYKGAFINAGDEHNVHINDGCVENRAVHVECAPPVCGMRQITINPYRTEEVDTSAEEIVAQFRPTREAEQENRNETILGDGRVVGGKACQPAAWPWVASIYRNGAFHCGGVLISDSWLLTAAHCVDKFWHYYYEVELGMLRRFSYSPMQQTRFVSDVIPNAGYNRGNLKNDLALMRLNAPVKYNRYVKPICLPTEVTAGKDYRRVPLSGTVCTVIGWGATVEHGTDPDQLREVEVPVLPYCKHKEDAEGNEICAGLMQGGKDACQGDSGGPFLCRNPNMSDQWYLAGIVSHGEGCARPNEPGVYTRVSMYMDWIYDHATDNMLPSRKPLHECPGYTCKSIRKCIPKKRRCDKTVDCLYGDDEMGCEKHQNRFSALFKHAMAHMLLDRDDLSRFNGDAEHSPNATTEATQAGAAHADDSIARGPFKMVNSTITNATAGSTRNDTSFASPASISDPDEFISNTGATPADGANAPAGSKVSATADRATTTTNSGIVGAARTGTFKAERFLCKKMLQVIPLSKKCDKIIDCQDGTDETSCTCADYLRRSHSDAICDGISDCQDLSDEKDCDSCGSQFYHCRLSNACIPIGKRCDNTPDCPHNEDEWDCFALTPSYKMILDADRRPVVNTKGLLALNHNDAWRPMCGNFTDIEGKLAADVCISLGFNDYERYLTLPVLEGTMLTVVGRSDVGDSLGLDEANAVKTNATCNGLYIQCSNRTTGSVEGHELGREDQLNAPSEVHMTPWNAAVYADGVFKCTGVILNLVWILTSIGCFNDILKPMDNYLAVRLGAGKGYLNVQGPHEQIIMVEQRIRVAQTDAILLRLAKSINFTRYVKPLHFYKKSDFLHYKGEICLATGSYANQTKTKIIQFQSFKGHDVKEGFRTFRRISPSRCQVANNTNSSTAWSGCIVCDAGNGFYPAALFHETNGECGFDRNTSHPSISFIKHDIFQAMERSPFVIDPPKCDGYRCLLGKCIQRWKVCNGIPDCDDVTDEDPSLCEQRNTECHLHGGCVCAPDEMRCSNAKCVEKTKFCDRVDDCGDGSDEPATCTCREYLNLVDPMKICDGNRNCYDRSDEDPELCTCRPGLFKCSNSQCIPNDMVCDGVTDCKDNSDESQCVSLKSPTDNDRVGEVMTRTAGIWHSGCFPEHMSTIELEGVCEALGFSGSSASYWKVSMNATAPRPQLEKFNYFWVHNTNTTGKLLLATRSGLNPFVTFIADPQKCNKLFIKCL